MSAATLSPVTSFEEEVLLIFPYLREHSPYHLRETPSSGLLVGYGRRMYGDEWGGPTLVTQTVTTQYPILDACLGRLQRKGLVQRLDTFPGKEFGSRRGRWALTDAGRAVVGLPPE